jgi:hypothetical protein
LRQRLEHDVALAGAVTVPAQCGQAQGVCGVVSQVEPAFQGERCVACVVGSRIQARYNNSPCAAA